MRKLVAYEASRRVRGRAWQAGTRAVLACVSVCPARLLAPCPPACLPGLLATASCQAAEATLWGVCRGGPSP